jgi:WD40 repeat protein
VAFSSSGKYLFAGYESNVCYGWNTVGDCNRPAVTVSGHTAKITALSFNSTGEALCTASVDSTLKVCELEMYMIFLFYYRIFYFF